MRAALGILRQELQGREPLLDAGTGTGRFGIPLHQAGIEITGIDISREMLAKLPDKGGRYPVVQADARRMPFAPASFGGALAFWVLHLIEDWSRAFDEVIRVLRPGGVFVVSVGGTKGFGTGCWSELQKRFQEVAGIERNIGADSLEEIADHARTHGLEPRLLPVIRGNDPVSPESLLSMLKANVFSFTWQLGEDELASAVEETRSWARGRYGDLDAPLDNEFHTEWHAYEKGARE